jgi:hypothetical protein
MLAFRCDLNSMITSKKASEEWDVHLYLQSALPSVNPPGVYRCNVGTCIDLEAHSLHRIFFQGQAILDPIAKLLLVQRAMSWCLRNLGLRRSFIRAFRSAGWICNTWNRLGLLRGTRGWLDERGRWSWGWEAACVRIQLCKWPLFCYKAFHTFIVSLWDFDFSGWNLVRRVEEETRWNARL